MIVHLRRVLFPFYKDCKYGSILLFLSFISFLLLLRCCSSILFFFSFSQAYYKRYVEVIAQFISLQGNIFVVVAF